MWESIKSYLFFSANDIRKIDNTRLPHNRIVIEYLKVIAKLTVNVCNKQITYDYEDSLYSQETAVDNDDDSDSENEPNPTSVREQMLLTRCIEMLNEPERCILTTCSQITDSDLSDEFLDSMSKICHNLLLSHRMALHKYRWVFVLILQIIINSYRIWCLIDQFIIAACKLWKIDSSNKGCSNLDT